MEKRMLKPVVKWGAKKGTKAYIKKEAREENETVDELFRWSSLNKGLSSNTYNAGKVGLLTINDNYHLMVRAFAYAWKFKRMYEDGVGIDEMAPAEKMSKRTVYKYLNLTYLSPRIINTLMSGAKTIDLQKLFEIASKYESLEEQEDLFLRQIK